MQVPYASALPGITLHVMTGLLASFSLNAGHTMLGGLPERHWPDAGKTLSLVSAIILGACNHLSTYISFWTCDKFGRRNLFLAVRAGLPRSRAQTDQACRRRHPRTCGGSTEA